MSDVGDHVLSMNSRRVSTNFHHYTVNNYRQVTGMVTGENFAFFIYRHFVEIL